MATSVTTTDMRTNPEGNLTPELCVTAIIRKEVWGEPKRTQKYLLLKRAAHKKSWPNLWTLPGGHIEHQDWLIGEANSEGITYNVVENGLRREVFEEAGIYIRNIEFVASLIFNQGSTVVLSMSAEQAGDHSVVINDESSDSGWFTLEEIRNLPTIDGILDEIILFEEKFYGGLQ